MSGFVDPITLGFLIALGGTALGVSPAKPVDRPVAAATSETKVVAAAPADAATVTAATVSAK
jgi:hypothetical protein